MNTLEKVIPPRLRDLGEGFHVRRAIPHAHKRTVGPFIFWDHMGPAVIEPDNPMSVRAHPHIGLSTLTYLFEGEILHRDSLGNEIAIHPGEVNWMTAGHGITHSERTQSEQPLAIEGFQIWVALPKKQEAMAPEFQHVPANGLPKLVVSGQPFTLVAGEYQGQQSPVSTHSPLVFLDSEFVETRPIALECPANFEMAIYVAKGEVSIENESFTEGHMAIFKSNEDVEFTAVKGSRVMVIGGQPFDEPRYIWWNFVASDESTIESAKTRWQNSGFESVIHETDRIPLPKR